MKMRLPSTIGVILKLVVAYWANDRLQRRRLRMVPKVG
jgi:hypothetical protein